MTNCDRQERFIIDGRLGESGRIIHATALTAVLPGSFTLPEEAHTLHETIGQKTDSAWLPAERLWQEVRTKLEPIIKQLVTERFQIKVWSGWEFRGYYDSLGSTMTSHFPLSKLKITVRARESNLIKRAGARKGTEFFEAIPVAWAEDFLSDVREAKAATKEEFSPRELILDPEAAAMFLHETIGHPSEGDHVLEGDSYLSSLLGHRITSPEITIVDSPKDYGGLGSYAFDDEGVPSQTTPLIEKGTVRGYLTDRNTGASLERKSTGNSRSFWYDSTPKVRMSNLVLLPGKKSLENILAETRDGVLVKGMKEGGCNERTGDFHFKPNIAYRIANGELKEAVAVPEVAGNARTYLNSITSISHEWSLSVAGCGKPTPQSDYAWVGYGAPFMRLELVP